MEEEKESGILNKLKRGLTPKKYLNAYDAYLMATYGVIESKEKRLETFYEGLEDLIHAKAQSGQYCCATEIPTELVKDYLKEIIKKYSDMGYTVIDLSDKIGDVKGQYLFITWGNKF